MVRGFIRLRVCDSGAKCGTGECMFIKTVYSLLLTVSMLVVLSGCQSVRPPAAPPFIAGATVESLSGNVSLAYTGANRSISGTGYLMYRKPDQMRMVIFSPFGSVLQEIFVSGELVTIVDVGNGTAFHGNFNELPATGDFSGWRHIHWLIAVDPLDLSRGTAVIKRINRFGESETASFENGLLITKTTIAGGKAAYGNYTSIQGVAVPLEIVYETAARETFKIRLEDPEVNIPFAENAFIPDLSRFRVYPLTVLK